jgi:hypothetical protein
MTLVNRSLSPFSRAALPALPLEEWEQTKDTLHLYSQIVGKIRLACAAPKNHWWHVPFYLTPRGVSTHMMRSGDLGFEISFDFVQHRVVITTERGGVETLALRDGLSVAEFYSRLFALLERLGIEVSILARSFGLSTPVAFANDKAHASYQAESVERFRSILAFVAAVFEEFAGWFNGKTSPVHLFWHGFDLAVTRFSGRRAPLSAAADPVDREAYTHEVISFGFWPGDAKVRAPAFYSYTAPEPPGLANRPLRPEKAFWAQVGSSHQARLWYEDLRESESPRLALLSFLQSAYEAGAEAAGWNAEDFVSTWAPPPQALRSLRGG